ncbi:MAG: hypothetical protein K8F59_02545 [Rhodobacteraceae bacterium]|nr:hypothetical protein [Paracoccaceae bacterium]
MIDKSRLFDNDTTQDAEGSCYAIFNLCKVGIAANDTNMAVDLTKGGYDALFEAIAALAEDAIERLEADKKA